MVALYMVGTSNLLVGGFNPSEKYESQLGSLFPTEWKVIKFHGSSHHQPDVVSGPCDFGVVSGPISPWQRTRATTARRFSPECWLPGCGFAMIWW